MDLTHLPQVPPGESSPLKVKSQYRNQLVLNLARPDLADWAFEVSEYVAGDDVVLGDGIYLSALPLLALTEH